MSSALRAAVGWCRRRSSWSVCLPRNGGRRGGSVISCSSHRLIQSTRHRLRLGSSHHLIDGDGASSPFRLTPSRRLFSACLLWLVPPSPAGGCAGRGMACGGGRAALFACLLSCPCRSLAPARSLVAICPRVVALRRSIRGVVWRFTGCSARLPVGVGVFQYMPLNRILWLLTGIFGDGVSCPFSALPVASSSSLRPASCPLPAAVSWRLCGRFPAVSSMKRRGGVLSCSGRFSLLWSCDWFGVVVVVCLMGVVGGSSCLPLFVRASPAPWGGGLYEADGRRFRFAVRGSGASL